jgi:hypothetical protein
MPYINRCYKAVGYMDEGLFIDCRCRMVIGAKSHGYSVSSPNARWTHTVEMKEGRYLEEVFRYIVLWEGIIYIETVFMVKRFKIQVYKVREITFNLIRFVVFLFFIKGKKIF